MAQPRLRSSATYHAHRSSVPFPSPQNASSSSPALASTLGHSTGTATPHARVQSINTTATPHARVQSINMMWSSELEEHYHSYGNLDARHNDPVHPRLPSPSPPPPFRLQRSQNPVPPLPTEILLAIIRASLPPVGEDSLAREEQLRACSLVSRQWNKVAQPELFRHVYLADSRGAMAFLACVEEGRGRQLARSTISLRLEDGIGDSRVHGRDTTVKLDARSVTFFLLRACVNLRHLRISDLPLEPSTLSIAVGADVSFRVLSPQC